MKTQLISKVAVVLTVFFSLALSLKSEAQIPNPYKVKNNTGCTFVVDWYAADPTCVNVCSSGSSVTLAPGITPLSWGLACAPAPCDFKILITQVGAATLSPPVGGSVLSGGTSFSNPSTSGCSAIGFTLIMGTNGAVIN